jgi:hypothetical protein
MANMVMQITTMEMIWNHAPIVLRRPNHLVLTIETKKWIIKSAAVTPQICKKGTGPQQSIPKASDKTHNSFFDPETLRLDANKWAPLKDTESGVLGLPVRLLRYNHLLELRLCPTGCK